MNGAGSRGRVLVVGGAGGMGAWFRRALQEAGWGVEVVDPVAVEGVPWVESLGEVGELDRFEFLVVAVPLGLVAEVVERVVERRPRGVVVEVASMQAQLEEALRAAEEHGVRVVGLHPMFGPGREVAGGEPLRFVLAAREERGGEERVVRELLAGLPARVVRVPFERHDELMAWVLGLAHLTALVFGRALAECGVEREELAEAASATFARECEAAWGVLGGNADLYFDIQRLNPHREEVFAAARQALDGIQSAIENGDRKGFRALFAAARSAVGEP